MHTYAPVCLYIRYDATLGMFKDFASYRYYAFIRWVSLFIRVMVHFTITCDVVHGMFDLNGHKYIKQSRERWYNDDEDKMHKPCFFCILLWLRGWPKTLFSSVSRYFDAKFEILLLCYLFACTFGLCYFLHFVELWLCAPQFNEF